MNAVSLINKLTTTVENVLIAQSGESINVKVFSDRDKLIENLESHKQALELLMNALMIKLELAQRERAKDISAMDALIKSTTVAIKPDIDYKPALAILTPTPTSTPNDAWTTVQKRKQVNKSLKQYTEEKNTQYTQPNTNIPTTNIKITEALSISAVTVPTFDQVLSDGNLYYVSNADHFAFRIAGRLLHGNIGTIYTNENTPIKIKDCRYQSSCTRAKCDYYHDPAKFIGSRDHRNYIASSFLYAPGNSHHKNKARSRRFGSRNNLDIDIVNMSEEEIDRFNSQVMHDFLCSCLLSVPAK